MVVSISTIPFGAPLNNAPTTKRCLKVGSDALRSTRRFSKLDVEKCHVLLTDLKLESYPPLPTHLAKSARELNPFAFRAFGTGSKIADTLIRCKRLAASGSLQVASCKRDSTEFGPALPPAALVPHYRSSRSVNKRRNGSRSSSS